MVAALTILGGLIMRVINKRFWLRLVLLASVMLLAVALPVGAEGDGSGDGQNVPLGLASSTPANGAQNVALDVQIQLVFNKNVINMTVKDNNQRCFALYAGSTAVPIEVQMADDQIYPELKRNVTLVPRQTLKAGTDYTVLISRALQAKNGATLSQDVKIKFSTIAAPVNSNPAAEVEDKTAVQSPPAGNADKGTQPAIKDKFDQEVLPADKAKAKTITETNKNTRTESNNKLPAGKSVSDDASKEPSRPWPAIAAGVLMAAGVIWWLVRRAR